jgi:8-oxo-dGTP diphosphatase
MGRSGKPRSLKVVAALIRERQSRHVLLTQRRPGRHLGLSWEFPGGKVEAGESDDEALRRELREELGVTITVGTLCYETRHQYGSREMHLRVYRACIVDGEPEALDVNAMEWVHEDQLLEREFLPADMPLVRGIAAGLVAHDEADGASDESTDDEIEVRAAEVIRTPD